MRAAPPPATTATRAAPPPASPQGSVKSLSGFDDHDASVEALMAEKENLVDALSREKEKLQKRNNEVDKLKVQNQSLEGEMTRAVARAGKFQNDLEVASRS
eukprot:725723-Rhodomonas_salina.1